MAQSTFLGGNRVSIVKQIVWRCDLGTINMWAKQSCPRWTRNKLERRRFRKLYRDAMMIYFNTPEHQRLVRVYKSCNPSLNTYPWPYCDPGFADWEENDSNEGYSLISDQSGCVVKYATSYTAYKIFEETGVWPQKTSKERLDAKRWKQFLAEAGYTEVADRPEEGHCYVGIDPNEGEFGLVVWFEEWNRDHPENVDISTYRNKEYIFEDVDPKRYTWVKID